MSAIVLWWRGWGDPQVDFGRDIYVAWRVAAGDVLYTDIYHLPGPFSVHWNAAVLRLGAGVSGIYLSNLLWLTALAGLLAYLFRRAYSAAAGYLAVATLLVSFAFLDPLPIRNYNYIAPYAHELTHGLVLMLAAVAAALHWYRTGRVRFMAGASLLAGLAAMTKLEVMIPAVASMAAVLGLAFVRRHAIPRPTFARAMLTTALLPLPAAAFATFLYSRGGSAAANGILIQFLAARQDEIRGLQFYQDIAGLSDIGASLSGIGISVIFWCCVVMAAAGSSRMNPGPRATAVSVGFVSAVALIVALHPAFAMQSMRGVPVILAGLLVLQFRAGFSTAGDNRHAGNPLQADEKLVLTLTALMLSAKMALAFNITHYGFVLALPATITVVIVLLLELPRYFDGKAGGKPSRAGSYRLVAGACLTLILLVPARNGLDRQFFRPSVMIGEGQDAVRVAAARVAGMVQLTAWLEEPARSGATFAVLPEGAMLNYWLRSPSPTPFITLMPPEVFAATESAVLDAFVSNWPDYIAVVGKDLREYGLSEDFRDAYPLLGRWIRDNYTLRDSVPGAAGGRPAAELLQLRKGCD